MSRTRFKAITESQNRKRINIKEKGRRSELFAQNVFNKERMLQTFTKDALDSV